MNDFFSPVLTGNNVIGQATQPDRIPGYTAHHYAA